MRLKTITMTRRTSRPAVSRAQRAARSTPDKPNSPIDPLVLFVVVTLVMIGLVVVYASTYHYGIEYLKQHAAKVGIGLAVLVIGIKLRHSNFTGKARHVVLFVGFGLLVATLIAGYVVKGARRWILFFQPAEIAKFALLLWLAAYYARLKEMTVKDWSFKNTVLKPLPVVGVFLLLLLLQPAISTAVILAASTLILLFVVGVKLRFLLPISIVAIGMVVLTVLYNPYARRRIDRWLEGNRYQQQQSLIAFGSGGPLGKGLGEGKQKYYFLPELHTDFIAAAIGEEFGFLGSMTILALYGALLLGGLFIVLKAMGYFGQFLATSIVVTLLLYMLVHMGVALGVLPPTGQPLPFVSYGGSALVSNLFAAGLLLNVSRFQRRRNEASAGGRWYGRPRLSRAGTRI